MKSAALFSVIMCCSLFCPSLSAQDTIAVYFPFGSSKANPQQMEALIENQLFNPSEYSIDSIAVIGMTDSVGSRLANKRLGLKRAGFVANELKRILPHDVVVSSRAQGETISVTDVKSRRVDVYIFGNELHPTNSLKKSSHKCFKIDYELINNSLVYSHKQGREVLVRIENGENDLLEKAYYYGTYNKIGKLTVKPVSWKLRRTGRKWWYERRYVTEIPMEAYTTAKLFTISKRPCDSCAQSFLQDSLLQRDTTMLYIDRFLMQRIQYRWYPINGQLLVRAPKELINNQYTWYSGCNTTQPLKWRKKRFIWNKDYLFTHLSIQGYSVNNISRLMSVCERSKTSSNCGDAFFVVPTPNYRVSPKLSIVAEIGLSQVHPRGFASIGAEKYFRYTSYGVHFGKYNATYQLSIKARFHFITLPLHFKRWMQMQDFNFTMDELRFYLGAEMGFQKPASPSQMHAHLGLCYFNDDADEVLIRIYTQYEYGILQNEGAPRVSGQFRIGTCLKLFSIY